jgi:hypothetical protein
MQVLFVSFVWVVLAAANALAQGTPPNVVIRTQGCAANATLLAQSSGGHSEYLGSLQFVNVPPGTHTIRFRIQRGGLVTEYAAKIKVKHGVVNHYVLEATGTAYRLKLERTEPIRGRS